MTARRGRMLLVCSSGGHLLQLMQLRDVWERRQRAWVTFDKQDARSLLKGERVWHAFQPTNRNLWNLVRNSGLALWIFLRERPHVLVTTGAGLAIPFCWLGRLFGVHVIYIESFARVTDRSLTGKAVRPVANLFLVQWPKLLDLFPGARYEGQCYEFETAETASEPSGNVTEE